MWELAVGVVGASVALVYLLAGSVFIGVGMAAAVLGWIAARVHPLELRGVAGGHARANARVEAALLGAVVIGVVSVVGLLVTAALNHWSRTPQGLVAVLALSSLEVMLMIEGNRHADQLFNWLLGANTEEVVSRELEALVSQGWFVTHNWKRERGGNIDHIVISPAGAFAIETKSRPYKGADGVQAIGAAMALRDISGISWVTAVVCPPGNDPPKQKGYVWVVGRDRLASWIANCQEHRGLPIDVDKVREQLAAA